MNSYILPATRAVFDPAESPLAMVTELWNQQSPYNRSALKTGVIHFGAGRFFRGHLARILHQYLTHKRFQDSRWGICGVSLRSQHTIETLQPQNFLYSLIERYSGNEQRETAEIIGSINQIVDGTQRQNYVLDLMQSPAVHLVTLTVTQAGYCLDSQFNLDFNHSEVVKNLRNPSMPTTAIGFIVEALRRRRDRGLAPFTTLSCDNLPRNGQILQQAVLAYADQIDPKLATHIRNEAPFPNTVVDRIVPQAQESDYDYPCRLLQVQDRAPIVTEPFWQFVVEENFSSDRPFWEEVGVTMTSDITPFLYMKSRLLNAMHSFIACLAGRAGIKYVHEALRQPEISWFIQQLMQDITAATPVSRQMCEQYGAEVLLRLSNESLPDTIGRIAAETSRKLGKYIVPILQDAYDRKVNLKRLVLPIAAWMLALREGSIESGSPYCIDDEPTVIAAIQMGASLSQILGLEACDCARMLDQECDRALRTIRMQGLFDTLRQYSEERCNDIISAA